MTLFQQLAKYHQVSASTITRLNKRFDVSDPIQFERAILSQCKRPESWLNGNFHRRGVNLPAGVKLNPRECHCNEDGYCPWCVGGITYSD